MRLVVLLALLSACSHNGESHPMGWREDLGVLQTTIATRHKNPFFHLPEADWRRSVADLDQRIPTLDDAHVLVGFARLVASLGDAHTRIGASGTSGRYPLAFTWFDDGIYVTGAKDASLIGKRLAGIGTHSTAEVTAALALLVPHENDHGIHDEVPLLLADRALLAGTDLAPLDHATFQLAGADGTIQPFDAVPEMTSIRVAPPRSLPLHLQGPNTYYWNKYVEADRLLYLAYNACANDDRVGPFATFAQSTLAFVDQHPVERFVVDLRRNAGGNSEIIQPLIDGLAARPNVKVYAIIGMHTFSSAMLAAMDLKRRAHATLVGGGTAGKPTSYGEIAVFELPHSKLAVQYSTKLFSNPDFPGDTVAPDIPVVVNARDWFDGRDPALDAITAR